MTARSSQATSQSSSSVTNGGVAAIKRLQKNHGGSSYNNMHRAIAGPGSKVSVVVDVRAAD